jgi:hypothetical protein
VCGGCFTYSKCDGDNMSKETTYNSSCPASTGSEGRQIRQIIGAMTNSEHDFSSWTSSLMPGFRSKWRRESDAAATVAAPALVHPRTQLGSGTRSPVLPAKRPCVLTKLNAAGSSYLILEPSRGASLHGASTSARAARGTGTWSGRSTGSVLGVVSRVCVCMNLQVTT